jgi:hypothetical protein
MRLAKYFNLTIDYWLNLQAQYDLAEAQKDPEFSTVLKSIPKAKKPKAGAKKQEAAKTVKSPKGAADKSPVKAPRGTKLKEEKPAKISRTTAKPKAEKSVKPLKDSGAKPADKPKRTRKLAPKAMTGDSEVKTEPVFEALVDEPQVKKPNTILIKNPDRPIEIEKPDENNGDVSPRFNFDVSIGLPPTDDIKETNE